MENVDASDAAVKFATEYGVALTDVAGSGRGGRIVLSDVKEVVEREVESEDVQGYDPFEGYSPFLTFTFSARQAQLQSELPTLDARIGEFIRGGYQVSHRTDWREEVGGDIIYTSWVTLVRGN
jgi:pyruvate/2-oxoglutarate dehydrogenase complex dihydrolipoamide acyltransferase (E2) component